MIMAISLTHTIVDLQIRRKCYSGCLVMFLLSETSVRWHTENYIQCMLTMAIFYCAICTL